MSTSNTVTVELSEDALNVGIKASRRNISTSFGLDSATLNAHIGQYDGIGPRYGMAPLPNHNHTEAATTNFPTGLGQSEGVWDRRRVYGVFPVRTIVPSSPNTEQTVFLWFTLAGTTDFRISHGAVYGSYSDAGGTSYLLHTPTSTMDAGLSRPNVVASGIRVQNYRMYSSLSAYLTIPVASRTWCRCTAFAVTGAKFPQPFLLSDALSNGSATTPPAANLNRYGVPKDVFKDTFTSSTQKYEAQTLNLDFILYRRYEYTGDLSTSYFTNTTTEDDVTSTQVALPASSTVTTGVTTSNALYELIKSEGISVASEFYCLAAAPGKAILAVYQDWVNSALRIGPASTLLGPSFQYIDPVRVLSKPPDYATTDQGAALNARYQENGVDKNTCWSNWTRYDGTTPLATDPGIASATRYKNLFLGPANSGILRRNTTYEFTFSLFDKSTNHETNVGTPALILTGNDDYTKLLFFGYITGLASYQYLSPQNYIYMPFYAFGLNPFQLQRDFVNRMNMIQYRIYFRERGTFEWLPAAYIDAPSLYDTTRREIWLCEGPFAGTVGCQPGGFNDASSLPDDAYFDVINYRGRTFWMSAKALVYSRLNDPFSYPVRNAVAATSGQFRGMIAHAYPGQAQQDSRLVIVTSESILIGRFRGQEYAEIQSVRVSSTAVADLPVEGSDFFLDTWTTQTAFSGRSVVSAQGILYYWGPTGIYKDVGNELPSKLFSEQLEPLLFNLYDPQDTENIHAVYNDRTKEVIWFFRPNPKNPLNHGSNSQKAICYKIIDDAWFIWDFGTTLIDSAQVIEAQFSNTNAKSNAGSRIMLMVRDAVSTSTPQRAVFFDEVCDSGDVTVLTCFLVKQVSVSGANRRLTFANGFSATLPSSGNLTISGYRDYRDTTSVNPDGIWSIAGSGANYVDIAPLAGASFPTTETISDTSKFFPVWIETLNGFSFRAVSQYWAARGMRAWQRWLYCYQSIKTDTLLRSAGQQMRLKFYTILGTGNSQRDITLTDNSRGNMQAHSQIIFDQQNAEGQALAIEWTTTSGRFNGSRWYVQYLSFDLTPMAGNNFKTWEA